jgi:Transposase DDE domain group 1
MTRLPCHRFRSNQVRLALGLLAYDLGNLWRRLTLPQRIENWSLTSLQQRMVKTGGRLVKHARYYWLLLAEGHLTRRRFGAMLRSISMLPVPAGQSKRGSSRKIGLNLRKRGSDVGEIAARQGNSGVEARGEGSAALRRPLRTTGMGNRGNVSV